MRAAIVTGVSRGLGEALAADMLSRGFTVLGIGRAASAKLTGERFRFAQCDLAEPAAIASHAGSAFAALAREPLESVALVNNAAVAGPIATIGDVDVAAAARALAINVVAPLALADLFCRTFTDDRVDRRIVNISSGSAAHALAGGGVYSIGKAAIEMLTAAIAAEHAERSFRCVALRPGIFETDMQREMRAQDPARFPSVALFRGFKEQGLLKDPADVASAIVDRMLLRADVEHGRVYPHTDLG
jgi:NAD(P)-dependent dehydrogenase (short-subunit alcohol dehydrogenase family)